MTEPRTLAVDIGGSGIKAVLLDEDGKMVGQRQRVPTPAKPVAPEALVRAIDEEALDALVPNLILQPIVENALEHGVSRAGESGLVEIGARRGGEQLVITVRDSGPGVGPSTQTGVGLGNTRARLEQLYGEAAAFSLRAGEGGGAIAEIVLPYRHV